MLGLLGAQHQVLGFTRGGQYAYAVHESPALVTDRDIEDLGAAVYAGRAEAFREALDALRAVAGLPPRAPTVELTAKEGP